MCIEASARGYLRARSEQEGQPRLSAGVLNREAARTSSLHRRLPPRRSPLISLGTFARRRGRLSACPAGLSARCQVHEATRRTRASRRLESPLQARRFCGEKRERLAPSGKTPAQRTGTQSARARGLSSARGRVISEQCVPPANACPTSKATPSPASRYSTAPSARHLRFHRSGMASLLAPAPRRRSHMSAILAQVPSRGGRTPAERRISLRNREGL